MADGSRDSSVIVSAVFSAGWDSFQARAESLKRRLSLREQSVNVGVLSSSEGDLAVIAATMEYGSPEKKIPARPFLRKALANRRLLTSVRSIAARYIEGKTDLETALNRLGIVGVAVVQQAIASNIPPPLAPSTIAAKGSSKTLIDTGRLRQSINYEIVSGGGTAVSTATAGKSKRQKQFDKVAGKLNRAGSRLQRKGIRLGKKTKRVTKTITKKVTKNAKRLTKIANKKIKKLKKSRKRARKTTRVTA